MSEPTLEERWEKSGIIIGGTWSYQQTEAQRAATLLRRTINHLRWRLAVMNDVAVDQVSDTNICETVTHVCDGTIVIIGQITIEGVQETILAIEDEIKNKRRACARREA